MTPVRHAPRHHVEDVMGMAVSIDIRDPVEAKVLDDVVRWFHHVDATYSTYKNDSPISRYGRGVLTPADLTAEITDVLQLCDELRVDTDGAFDPWSVTAPNGTMFDPSGVVKGWAVECAAERLEAHGCTNFCLNAGGDIAIRGTISPGVAWRIGLRHPYQERALAQVLQVSGPFGIATSATYERGQHIVDPATKAPAAAVASATVVGPSLTFADAYATAVFVKGVDGLEWLQEYHPAYHGFVVLGPHETLATEGFLQLAVR
jgi:thiamine biosynthesis lipoprotein